jgi:Zn-dependent membrane protease YugP
VSSVVLLPLAVGFYSFLYDPTLLIVMIPAALLSFGAQIYLKSQVAAMSQMRNKKGMTGAQVAQAILDRNGIHDVRIEQVGGVLSDHYSPGEKVLRLSPDIYAGTSVTSMGVAAHEVGHAIQHAQNYAPLALRSTIAPAAAIGSGLGLYLIPFAISFHMLGLAKVGILVFSISTLFTLVTLPVEFNASSRGLAELEAMQLTWGDEWVAARKVLFAAALTYVAAAATSVMYLLFFILQVRDRRN